MRSLITALFLLLHAAAAQADGTLDGILTAEDKARLARFDQTLAGALDEAAAGAPADVAVLRSALDGKPLPLADGYDPRGNWSCRVLKLGKIAPLTVYPPFKCVIGEDDMGWMLRKVSGSQRTEGHFYTESTTRLVYVGAGHVQGENPRRYGESPDENQVAIVERLGEKRILLFFPQPQYESNLDILVLEK